MPKETRRDREREAERRGAERSTARRADVGRDMARLGGRTVDTLFDDRARGPGSPLGMGARKEKRR